MSARDNLIWRLTTEGQTPISRHWAERQIDAYAHELAERQRTELASGTFFLRVMNPCAPYEVAHALAAHLSDLIDPEVST